MFSRGIRTWRGIGSANCGMDGRDSGCCNGWSLLPVETKWQEPYLVASAYFCVLGILWVKEDLRKEQKYDEIVSEVEGKEIEIKGILVGIQEKKDSDKLVLELDRVSLKKEGKKQPYGKVLAYMDKMDTCLRIGMTLCLQGELEGFDKPGNPGEFDYKGYYHALGIQGRFLWGKVRDLWNRILALF